MSLFALFFIPPEIPDRERKRPIYLYSYSEGSGTVNEVLQDERLPLTVRKERIGKETLLSRKEKMKALDCGLLMDTETISLHMVWLG